MMDGLTGTIASTTADGLAKIYNVSAKYVYKMTADLRPRRKRRADHGRRKFTLAPGTDTYEAAALVIGSKLKPEAALLTAAANNHKDLPSLYTMQRLLRENGLDGKRRKSNARNHRRWEAAAPLDLIQIDCTALKVRWKDIKTRRILRIDGIDKNHPQMDRNKLRVWQIMAVDDHSRRRFLRYVACGHITSRHMVLFCCELFCEWGLSKKVYTDNGPEFKGFFAKAMTILNSVPAIQQTGGIEHFTHMPNNPQASGKVENAHRWAEDMDRFVGLAEQKGLDIDENILNQFADNICRNYNEQHVNRTTGQRPIDRWFGTAVTRRMLPGEVVRAALLFDEAERKVSEAMTVRVGKIDYRLPSRDAAGKAAPWRPGMKLSIIAPHELDLIFVTLENGDEYEVEKVIATLDVAGDYKSAMPTGAEQLAKELKEHHAQKNREAKEKKKLTGEVYQVPFYNHEIAAETTNLRHFPHATEQITADDIAAVVPVPLEQSAVGGGQSAAKTEDQRPKTAAVYEGKLLTYWLAVSEFKSRFATVDECKSFLAADLFPDQQGEHYSSAIEQAVAAHLNPSEEVKLRLAG